jgi:diguanylate cyclase (GGDEF)-like protein
VRPLHSVRFNTRIMAYTAASMYAAAGFDGALSGVIPGDPATSWAAVLCALALAALVMLIGPRLPRMALAPLGPIGVGIIAYALLGNPPSSDGATLYVWPVLWTSFFFGRRGAVAILACVGLAHGVLLLSLPANSSYFGRWIDVMISASVVAVVVELLARSNHELLMRLAGEARTDELTGLLNRRGLDERAAFELARATRERYPVAVAAFDIDHFKDVNDEWGHAVGDLVLAHVGSALSSLSRDIDIAARVGGEEFVVVLPGSESAEADAFTERIRDALAGGGAAGLPSVGMSAGVAVAMAPRTLEVLLERADRALYAAKRAGRDRTVVSEQDDPRLVPAGVAR